jgi:pimeloyl-ACP methyl ester carboxylesterase
MPEAGGIHYYSHTMGKSLHPVIVLLHGLGGDYLSWPVEIRRLPGYDVFTPDLPGHGDSKGPGMQSVNDYATSIVKFMDVIAVWQAIFVGHSMGGAIALALACQHPERTAGFAVISSGSRLPIPREIMDNAVSPTTYSSAVNGLQDLMRGSGTSPRLVEQNAKRLLQLRPSLVLGDLIACNQFDVTDQLASINIPSLVISGAEDKLTPPRFSTSLAAHIHGSALQTIDVAGHLLPLEQPTRLAKLLAVFFNSISV